MEQYPGELLVGVFPLIFCVDATVQKTAGKSNNAGGEEATDVDTGADDNNDEKEKKQRPPTSSSSNRSQFDKFLDAMAASLMADPVDEYGDQQPEFPGGVTPQRSKSFDTTTKDGGASTPMMSHPLSSLGGSSNDGHHGGDHHHNPLKSLFRGDESDDNDSDIEDDLILGSASTADANNNTNRRGSRNRNHNRKSLPKIGIPRIGSMDNRNNSFGGGGGGSAAVGAVAGGANISFDTSFAHALQLGQSYFQRARIISISSRHGFPPSKDPAGQRNRIEAFFDKSSSQSGGGGGGGSRSGSLKTSKLLAATQKSPIDGIIPSGWLEKHAAALPSVILVVVQIQSDTIAQSQQDQLLLDTLENLQHSLAPKRQVLIQVVGLVQDGVSKSVAEKWAQKMAGELSSPTATDQQNHPKPIVGVGGTGGMDSPPQPVVLVPASDLQPDASYSLVMQQLHERVRNASFEYYWNRCKDVKQKLCRLGPSRTTPLLLLLSIRYCFKVSMFYEFQWKQEKSLKYMLESYRLLEMYYRYLLQQREVAQDDSEERDVNIDSSNPQGDDFDGDRTESTFAQTTTSIADDRSEGVELSLSSSNTSPHRGGGADDSNMLLLQMAPPPEDMIYQCRAVADWLNFKILQHSLASNTEGGFIAASMQIARHAQAFCSPHRSFICPSSAPWLDWSYVSQQWLVISQLLERHPPRNIMGNLGGENDEVLVRCSAWRAYESAASSLLRAGKLVQSCKDTKPEDLQIGGSTKKGKRDDIVRTRYVGGIDHEEGFMPALADERKLDHKELALSCATRGLSLFQKDNESISGNNSQMNVWSRASGRLHYLAGGTLVSMNKYSEALPHILQAIKICSGWDGLEMITRKMLITCFQKIPKDSLLPLDQTDELVPMVLDSLFAAKLEAKDLQSSLEHLSSFTESGSKNVLEWKKEFVDEADQHSPFSFSVTFPNGTHATAGDGIEVFLRIQSNLNISTKIDSLVLHSTIGDIEVPSSDLSNAIDALTGTGTGLAIKANQTIIVSTKMVLPTDVCEIGEDGKESKSPAPSKYSKSARPRTAGITAAAGARFIVEKDSEDGSAKHKNPHWSHVCLGGRSLSCDGMQISFYPTDTTVSNYSDKPRIDLAIKKVAPQRDVHVKRTPFEEENYIASAWNRQIEVPLDQGPRYLRALNPTAAMVLSNVTEASTNGCALEGTVNRILLKLTSGDDSSCADMKIWIKSSSTLIAPDGTTKSIAVIDDNNLLLDNAIDITNPRVRAPVLVVPIKNTPSKGTSSSLGFDLPTGWDLFGENGQGDSAYRLEVKDVKPGEQAYIFLDVFRPTPTPAYEKTTDTSPDYSDFDNRMCRTDIEVSVTYNQCRNDSGSGADATSVTLFETVSVAWSAPISSIFCPAWKDAYPSGNRHPSNFVADVGNSHIPSHDAAQEMVLIDKEKVTTRCTMEAMASDDGLEVEIDLVRFANTSDQNSPCSFDLLSGLDDDENGVMFKAKEGDIGRQLGTGSKFAVSWTVRANMQSAYLKGSVTSALGELIVYWHPTPMGVPEDVVLNDSTSKPIRTHGPLPLETPSIIRFKGPPCYIENSPFEACAEQIPDTIRQSQAFDVAYSITNKTPLDQQLDIELVTTGDGFLVSGLMNGSVDLGPFERHTFSFTVVPTRVGEVSLPLVAVASKRYQTWVIHEHSSNRHVFVIP